MGGAIATPHVDATRAGVRAYARGGNALDAAVAAAAVLTVVYPHQTAIGGDLWAVVADPGGAVRAVDGSGAAPAGVDVGALRSRFDEMPDTGPAPVTVPGTVSAWETLVGLGAELGLAAAIEPAAVLARDGIEVSHSLAVGIRSRLDAVSADEGLRGHFTDDGAPLTEGAQIRQPALARSLEQIAAEGGSALYHGEIGRAFVEGLRGLGSPMTPDDLQAHRTEIVTPLTLDLAGVRFATAPPGSQGFVLLEMLAALGTLDPEPGDALAAALLGIEDRDAWLGDPRLTEIPLDRLLDPEQARARLGERRRTPAAAGAAGGDTVAVVAVDADGRAV